MAESFVLMVSISSSLFLRMLGVENTIRKHKFFAAGARTAIECYVHLVDHPVQDEEAKKDEASGMISTVRRYSASLLDSNEGLCCCLS